MANMEAKSSSSGDQMHSGLSGMSHAVIAASTSESHHGCSNSTDELLHELQIHQAELQMQNEALRESRIALEESIGRYIDFYELSPAGCATLSDAGLILEINLTGAGLLGLGRQKLLRRRFSRFVAPEYADQWYRHMLAVLAREGKQAVELALLRNGGTRFHVQVDCVRVIKDGRAPVIRLALTDISERKRVESVLQEQEEFFRMIAENVSDYIAVLDCEGRRLYNNPSYRNILGDGDWRGTDSFSEIHPDDRQRVVDAFIATVRSGRGGPVSYRFTLKDGSIRHMESVGGVIRDSCGHVARVVVISRDMTEHINTEEQLRISAVAFETQEGIFITNAEAKILKINRAFTAITGYVAEDVIGRTPAMLESNRHDIEFHKRIWARARDEGAWQGEVWSRRKGGEDYPEWLNITAVRDTSGILTHYVGTMTDITERKASEAEIEYLAFNDHLTGLPNRRLLMDRLQHALSSSNRNGRFGALLFVDLDKFKHLNDTLGHDQGDLILQLVSRRLRESTRDGDTVARLGGDEFVVLLENLSSDPNEAEAHAKIIGNKILQNLSQIYHLSETDLQCTSSIGATVFGGLQEPIEQLLKQADRAMYQAKDQGRNAFCVWKKPPPVSGEEKIN
ncbi:PAS domain S-box protein [Niveibacterium sp. 24ML]|uniref:sensor domain-containing protein n=1 Tax=Niveibacterium sp. 24ML TaxID=2985512 RepID=UPI00226E0524|nr:PAS domain S-box protein [Niveibacterium sp. 24ML]MCX9158503.1 PAS domain S-box protein [Niveibacterium sp. 24ML]